MEHSTQHRPHLDGVRALAVALVLLFHFGVPGIDGGFVGVDVFFVLSGYLITGLLRRQLEDDGGIRLGRFYARRARRLLPASLIVLLAVVVGSWFALDAVRNQDVGRDAVSAALYVANLRFAFYAGEYFAPGDTASPVLHYWTLAVEEQFYLAWPIALLVGWRVAARLSRSPRVVVLGAVGLGIAASATLSVLLAGSPLTYYGPHTRAYQLLAGAALALLPSAPGAVADGVRGRRLADGAALAGGAALVALALTVDDAGSYPGLAGLAVAAASVALVLGVDRAPAGIAARVLGHAAPAAVGRLSYSLYIWHWPIIVLGPGLVAELDLPAWTGGRPALVVVTLVAAVGSYLLIEQPVRFRLRPHARPGAAIAVGLAASLLVAGVAHWRLDPPSTPWTDRALAAVSDVAPTGRCPYDEDDWPAPERSRPCVVREGDGRTIALVGDSHAQQWQPALERLAEQEGARLVRVTRAGCAANDVVTYSEQPNGRTRVDEECATWRRAVLPRLVEDVDPDLVFVATRSHVRGIAADGRQVGPEDPEHVALWRDGWDRTLATLLSSGARVVVADTAPTLPGSVPACLVSEGEAAARDGACDHPLTVDPVVPRYDAALAAAVAEHPGAGVARLTALGCPDGTCAALAADDVVVRRDSNHLSRTFVASLSDEVGAAVEAAGTTP